MVVCLATNIVTVIVITVLNNITHSEFILFLFQVSIFDEMAGQQAYFTFQHKWLILTYLGQYASYEALTRNITNIAFISLYWHDVGGSEDTSHGVSLAYILACITCTISYLPSCVLT